MDIKCVEVPQKQLAVARQVCLHNLLTNQKCIKPRVKFLPWPGELIQSNAPFTAGTDFCVINDKDYCETPFRIFQNQPPFQAFGMEDFPVPDDEMQD